MSTPAKTSANHRLLTIGTVTRRLQEEFPEISISKIRYLEDQGLLAPRRTQGGYRLFSEEDVERLETILRLQRDEFLPLRVIREELSSPGVAKGTKRRRSGLSAAEDELDVVTGGRTHHDVLGTDCRGTLCLAHALGVVAQALA